MAPTGDLSYWNQNTHITDFIKLMADFALHLKNRRHKMIEIEMIMLEASKRIDSGNNSNNNNIKI
jgi:hypothetical protein